MKAEIYSQDGKLIRSIEANSILNEPLTNGSTHVILNSKAVAIVYPPCSVILVDDSTPPNWESPK